MKRALFLGSGAVGVTRILRNSSWRARNLLILAYHGVSIDDEHAWNPSLFIPQALLRERLQTIRDLECAVLPLGEGVKRLYAGTLPPRAVAITFDDGNVDFQRRAWPVLREFGYPVTVYWTTYYSTYPRPVPDVTYAYLLWKARSKWLEWGGMLPRPVLLDERGRAEVLSALMSYAAKRALDARQKDELIGELSQRLGIDYPAFCEQRLLQIMKPEEAAAMARAGVDLQLHTHRHRTPKDRRLLLKELEDNREAIQAAGAPRPEHFCYPSGCYSHLDRGWLRDAGVLSAVTCDPAVAGRENDRYELPRFVDSCATDRLSFEAWLSGLPQLLPRRKAEQVVSASYTE